MGTAGVPSLVLLHIVTFNCKSKSPCSTQECSCTYCTTYCKCGGDENCANEHTKSTKDGDDTDCDGEKILEDE